MKLPLLVSVGLGASLVIGPVNMAQSQDLDEQITQTIPLDARKQLEINRTDAPPVIDGVLDDPVWQQATRITDLHQYQPVDQGVPTESSVFYITYDENYFYLAARLHDSDPDGIIARQLIQGQGMPFDDAFEFILDTFDNNRTGYLFQVNPNGIRREGVFEGPNNLNTDWTGIWVVESRITESGWTAELRIPFNTLNFDPEHDQWGFTVGRTIARKREEVAWSSFNRQLNPTTTGLITGLSGMRQGVGLDIIPSVALATNEDHVAGTTDTRFDPSVNVFYKFTPNLTGALTVNTDFSATEVDNREVNLSRFSLFFPEKRDFFLQDVDIFSFGGLGGGGFNGNRNGIPFYSRRIGLSLSGEPVDLEAGLKLSGRVAGLNVGALAVKQDEFGAVDSQELMVARAAANVLEESSIGIIMTSGNPTSNLDNSLVGADFRYQNSRFTETHGLSSNWWIQESDTEGQSGDQRAYGASFDYNTQGTGFSAFGDYSQVGESFNPGLGFANRVGVERMSIGGNYRYFLDDHPSIRNLFSLTRFEQTRYLDTDEMQSESWFWDFLSINNHLGDQLRMGVRRDREGLREDFEISPGVIIEQGKYAFAGYNIQFEAADQRRFAPRIRYNHGDYFDGEREIVEAGFNWRPNAHLRFGMDYRYQDIELPSGEFDVRLITIDANYAFNNQWSWVNLLQYDNFSDSVGLNSRLRWNPRAGENLFVVINYNFDSEGTLSRLSSLDTEIVLKYSKTLRF